MSGLKGGGIDGLNDRWYFRQSEVCVHRGAAFLGVVLMYRTGQGGEVGLERRVGAQPRCCVQFLLCTVTNI